MGLQQTMGFPGGSDDKESACKAGDPGSIPGLGRTSGEGNGYLLQYSCLENSMDRGAWQTSGFPGGSDGKEFACNAGDLVQSPGGEDPLEKGMVTTSVFLLGKFHGQRRLKGCSPRG